jgi:hypothetical protein
MTDYKDIIYGDLDFPYDSEKIKEEILSLKDNFFEIPPYKIWLDQVKSNEIFPVETENYYNNITYITVDAENRYTKFKKTISPPTSLYLRNDFSKDDKSYSKTKNLSLNQITWNKNLLEKIPYTKSVIEKLPFDKLGLVRVFLTENSFLPTHHDGSYNEWSKNIAINLVPESGKVPFKFSTNGKTGIKEVYSNCFIFNDRYLHGIPYVPNLRIDIRIFGEFNSKKLNDSLIKNTILNL